MTFEILFVLLALLGMVIALVLDKMRPGMVLFSVVVLFLCAGILTPKEMLEGFSNKGMMTVAMLFLVSEGIRQSGALGQVIKKLLPQGKTTVFKAQFRMLPTIAFISAFLNNTPVVVIFAPIIKRWAESVKLPHRQPAHGHLARMGRLHEDIVPKRQKTSCAGSPAQRSITQIRNISSF